jgi:4-oxalocrotonate tautomerase
MPHVHIKHFPALLSPEKQGRLVAALTEAITEALGCPEGVVSIALEPVDKDDWNEQVYVPEIVGRKELLIKQPSY